MSESNQKTLSAYESHIEEYINGTPQEVSGDVKNWINRTLDGLSIETRILEFGSAFGRDADYIEDLGYTVQRTDATVGFVEYLTKRGHEAEVLNIITDPLPGDSYDLIFADAVLLHLTTSELEAVVRKVRTALIDGGRFSFSLKSGIGEEWSDAKLGVPRYFRYWQQDDITEVLSKSGFSKIDVQEGSLGRNNAAWLHIIAQA